MADDIDLLTLNGQNVSASVREAITEAKITRTIDSSPTLELRLFDPKRTILNSHIFDGRTTAQFADYAFEVARISKEDNYLTVTMEDLAVAELRRWTTPRKADKGKVTRIDFVRQILADETPQIKLYVDPSVRETVALVELARGTVQTAVTGGTDPIYGATSATPVAVSTTNALSAGQIAGAARAAGFPDKDIPTMVAIAFAESGGRPAATNSNTNKSTDYGLWQINSIHKALLAGGTWSDPLSNAKMAYSLYKGRGGPTGANRFKDWVTYNTGAHKKFMAEGQNGLKLISSDYSTSGQTTADASSLEDSWSCFKRIFAEVGWRLYADRGNLYAGPDSAFIDKDPAVTLREFTNGVDFVDFDYDRGKPVATLDITCRAQLWICPPGSVIEIPDLGLPRTKWLCSSISRTIFSKTTKIKAVSPSPELAEPADEGLGADYTGEALAAAGGVQGSGQATDGVYIWPVSARQITSPFGQRARNFHQGIDIACPDGSPVIASRSGTVTQVYNEPKGYGNVVYIAHRPIGTDNVMGPIRATEETRYGHLSAFKCRKGQVVSQGDLIGLSGHTGDATGPHLHFEIRVSDKLIDPISRLSNSKKVTLLDGVSTPSLLSSSGVSTPLVTRARGGASGSW